MVILLLNNIFVKINIKVVSGPVIVRFNASFLYKFDFFNHFLVDSSRGVS